MFTAALVRARASLLCALLLEGCIVYPRAVSEPAPASCRLVSRQLRLDAVALELPCNAEPFTCLLGLILLGGGSTVVSGSIVLVGNTVHWIERQGRCEDQGAEGDEKKKRT